jgi:hypothetical protein
MTTSTNLRAVFIGEPLELVKAQPQQLFISTASVALMGSFASTSNILHPVVGYLLAIGIEWAYFRGLASDSKAPTRWGSILNWSACIVVVLWGMLWVAGFTGAIDAQAGGAAGWWLAAAHVIPIAWLSLCSAQTHRAAMVQQVATQRAEAARQRAREEADLAYQRQLQQQRDADRLDLERKERELALWEQGMEAKARLKMRSRAAQANTPNTGPNSASGTGTNNSREQLREQIRRTLQEHPNPNKSELARRLGIGRTLLYEIIAEIKNEAQP